MRYFGDHKAGLTKLPGTTTGNAALLDAFTGHQAPTPEERAGAAPLLLFRAVSRNGRVKGFVEFLIDLSAENDQVDWDWITARRSSAVSDQEALAKAPRAWREWVKRGHSALPRVRRRVARARVTKVRDQRPAPGSGRDTDLKFIYAQFDGRKHDFEAVASAVAARVLRGSGHNYREGWITRRSGDGGADFVGRIDLGAGLAGTSLVVLGQAKCIHPDSLVSAEQIARVVARLRRGWIGIYVTTGSFSEPAQLEMVEDQYPILLVNGLDVARELRSMARDDHGDDLAACLDHILHAQGVPITSRRPEEILLD
ncbi:restriction endonuclease [Streptomyces sp. NPDC004376]